MRRNKREGKLHGVHSYNHECGLVILFVNVKYKQTIRTKCVKM